MTEIPQTQDEFNALMETCFCCGAGTIGVDIRPYQIAALAMLGIEHRLCESCATSPMDQLKIANLVEGCVVLALADERAGKKP